jgi:hypothetical protein
MSKLRIKKARTDYSRFWPTPLTRLAIPMLENLEKGDQVYWAGDTSDPKDIYIVRGLEGNIVFLINSEGNEVEAFNYEVKKV